MAAEFKQLLKTLKDGGAPIQVLLPGPGAISAKIDALAGDIVSLSVTLATGSQAKVTMHTSSVIIVS